MNTRITKVTITVRIDYQYDDDQIVYEAYREDAIVQNREDGESDKNFIGRAGVILEYTKARLP